MSHLLELLGVFRSSLLHEKLKRAVRIAQQNSWFSKFLQDFNWREQLVALRQTHCLKEDSIKPNNDKLTTTLPASRTSTLSHSIIVLSRCAIVMTVQSRNLS